MINKLFEGLDPDTKSCNTCNNILPLHSFPKESGRGYLRNKCKKCHQKEGRLLSDIKKNTAPAPLDYKCPVCHKLSHELTSYGKNKKSVWVPDHNHETGEFRGWLCHKCNLGLGNLNDDPERCKRAMDYLNENR